MSAVSDHQLKLEKYAGIALIASASVALIAANSPLADAYDHLLHLKLGPAVPRLGQMSLHEWIADGLMAIFFLLVGLEVKREWYDGRLSTPAERRLPIIAAASGMAVPALIYLAAVSGDPGLAKGWAIPAATDIAFAVGVLAILGRHAPASIKLLLVTIAIVDDIGAVLVIALFYTADLNVLALAAALAVTGGMAALGQFGVRRLSPYIAGFLLLWLLVLASGVHATISGVLAALTIPLGRGEERSPLKRLEHSIHPWVMFGVVPLFGLASAGVELPALAARDPARIVRWQAARHFRCDLADREIRARTATGMHQLASDLWRCDPLRHRLHHEPVHRRARLSAPSRSGGRSQDRHARRIDPFGRCRLCDASVGTARRGDGRRVWRGVRDFRGRPAGGLAPAVV
jgi:Na+/H+ antiporter NhaA